MVKLYVKSGKYCKNLVINLTFFFDLNRFLYKFNSIKTLNSYNFMIEYFRTKKN